MASMTPKRASASSEMTTSPSKTADEPNYTIMFDVVINRFQRNDQSNNDESEGIPEPQASTDHVIPEQYTGREERPGIKMIDIRREEDLQDVEVVETGLGLLHILLAGLMGTILGTIATVAVLIFVGLPSIPIMASLGVIA